MSIETDVPVEVSGGEVSPLVDAIFLDDLPMRDLNMLVTDAIFRAERAPSDEAAECYREVGELEEAIARRMGPGSIEGDIARRGAVTAALSAGDPERAISLARAYLSELQPEASARALLSMVHEALREMAKRVP